MAPLRTVENLLTFSVGVLVDFLSRNALGHSQELTVAASALVEKRTVEHRS